MKSKIGTITLGEKAYLSDPCYDSKPNGFYNCVIDTIPGEYYAFVTRSESKGCSKDRITSLLVVHKDYYPKFKTMPRNYDEMLFCCVDSGTCGIFDKDYFEKYHSSTSNEIDEDWYDKFVIEMEEHIITDNKGVISISGWGNGRYPVFAEYVNKKAFAIRIKFL